MVQTGEYCTYRRNRPVKKLRYIDLSTPRDYDAVVRHLNSADIPIQDRNKLKLVISAELTDEQVAAIDALPLEEVSSIGTSPLP